jgi:hypothetical protein
MNTFFYHKKKTRPREFNSVGWDFTLYIHELRFKLRTLYIFTFKNEILTRRLFEKEKKDNMSQSDF